MHKAFLPPTMSSSDGYKCASKLDFCPKGHKMEVCEIAGEAGRYCKQCGEFTFQPNQNRFGDQCRMKKTCGKYRTKYKQYGDKTTDANCECEVGFHFENEDQRACVPNAECQKGFGQGVYEDRRLTGICEQCIDKGMWSGTVSSKEKCKPLRNCEKESRCTITQSNGTFDNKCGPKVQDVSDCDSIIHTTTSPSTGSNYQAAIIGGSVGGALLLLLLLCVVMWCIKRRRRVARQQQLRREELEEMLPEIIKRSRKDEHYCKKVLDLLQKEVEDRINNQIWALAQELFRNHTEPKTYEDLLTKYGDAQHKYAINGYMQDWRCWRGNQGDAVQELVCCLQCDRVKRVDIVLEVVSKLREDFPEVVEAFSSTKRRSMKPGPAKFCAVLFPCMCKDKEQDVYECKDTSMPFLSDQTVDEKDAKNAPNNLPPFYPVGGDGGAVTPTEAGVIYRNATTPSAPVLDVDMYPSIEVKGSHFYDRSESLPVQASS